MTPKDAEVTEAIARWAALFPAKFETGSLACWEGASWVPRLGLVAGVSLYDATTYAGPTADLVLAAPGELDRLDLVIARVQAVIDRFTANDGALRAALNVPISDTLGLGPVVVDGDTFAPTPEDTERRQQALADTFARFDAVAARMKQVYGLRLPRHLAVWAAFCRSLSPIEAVGLKKAGRCPAGIMLWFEDGGLDVRTIDGLDPRLEGRFRADPPEFVTVMAGDSDGLHYGLWYDDPAELPSFVASNYARDSAETSADEATVVRELASQVRRRIEAPDYPEEPTPLCIHALSAAIDWFQAADEKALADDGARRWADVRRGDILGGMAPALPASAGDPRATYEAHARRQAAYRDPESAAQVAEWIREAKAELAQSKPAFALVLGRELHWLDADAHRAVSLELLCAAYEALGRDALAAIATVHHAHRDLQSVSVHEHR